MTSYLDFIQHYYGLDVRSTTIFPSILSISQKNPLIAQYTDINHVIRWALIKPPTSSNLFKPYTVEETILTFRYKAMLITSSLYMTTEWYQPCQTIYQHQPTAISGDPF